MAQASAGAEVPVGSRVTLIVSEGALKTPAETHVTMPDLTGMEPADAREALGEVGLTAELVGMYAPFEEHGRIASQWPLPGEEVPGGWRTLAAVSEGPVPEGTRAAAIPYVVGRTQTEARAALEATGLIPEMFLTHSSAVPAGVVVAQVPGPAMPGADRARDPVLVAAIVGLVAVIALLAGFVLFRFAAEDIVTVPDVVGVERSLAESVLASAGLAPGTVVSTAAPNVAAGHVVSQTPRAGARVAENTPIDLVVSAGAAGAVVPPVTSLPQERAERSITEAGLVPRSTRQPSNSVASGNVISQSPPAGTAVASGTTVEILVSSGDVAQANVTVPSVEGDTREDARAQLESAGLAVFFIETYDDAAPAGEVLAQLPAAGDVVVEGATIGVIISRGPPPGGTRQTVPDVVGSSRAEAEAAITDENLRAETLERAGSGVPAGEVLAQWPPSGTRVPDAAPVLILLSDGT